MDLPLQIEAAKKLLSHFNPYKKLSKKWRGHDKQMPQPTYEAIGLKR